MMAQPQSSLPVLTQSVQEISTPCFLVDINIVKRNAAAMLRRCKDLGIKLRPHMKTAKTL